MPLSLKELFSPSCIGFLSVFIRVYLRLIFCLLCAASGAAWAQSGKPAGNVPTYAKELRPILQARCVVCHSSATVASPVVSGGLALDSYAALKKGVVGKDGAHAIYQAGKSGESELMRRLTATSPTKMMPKGGPPLPPTQIALFKRWIDAGAPAGNGATEAAAAPISAAALPMPADPGALDVTLSTLLKPTAALLKKDAPKDAALEFALKVGPLPPITALAYSPDGKTLAVGGYRAVMCWDTTTGRPTGCLTHLAGPALSLAYSPDGKLLAIAGGAAGASGEVRVVDAHTLAAVGPTLNGHTDLVYSVAWSPDGKQLATASQDKTALLWEWPSGKQLLTFRDHSDAVTQICFAPDGKSVYTAAMDHNVRRFDTKTGQAIRTFTGHGEAVTALAVSPDGKSLVSAGTEPRLRWWNLDNGDTIRNADGHDGPVNAIVFSKDGKFLASASADHTVRLWDASNGNQQRALEGSNDWLYAVAIRPDGKFVAGAGADGMVRLWETASGRLRLSLLAWPPAEHAGALPDWAAITPEGYFDASPAWAARLRPLLAGKPVSSPRLTQFVKTLRQPDNVAKSWQGAALDPAKLPSAPPAEKDAPPPAKKSVTQAKRAAP